MKRTKSVKWTCPSPSSSTLSGLMSLWMMFCPCMYLIAQPSSAIQNLTASSVNVFLDMWNRRSPPLIRSTTRYLVDASQPSMAGGTVPAAEGTLHVLNVLEAVSQVTNERVVHMLQHSSLSDDIADAFGADDWIGS